MFVLFIFIAIAIVAAVALFVRKTRLTDGFFGF